jgi:DNA-binding response OmpR family regulator
MAKRIVLVDDEAMLSAFLGEALTASGYEVTVVSDEKGALSAIAHVQPDLVLLDFGKRNGRLVLDRIAEGKAPPSVILLLGSGVVDFELPPFVRETLDKPATSIEVAAAVARAFEHTA